MDKISTLVLGKIKSRGDCQDSKSKPRSEALKNTLSILKTNLGDYNQHRRTSLSDITGGKKYILEGDKHYE